MEVSTLFYNCRYCVFTWWGRIIVCGNTAEINIFYFFLTIFTTSTDDKCALTFVITPSNVFIKFELLIKLDFSYGSVYIKLQPRLQYWNIWKSFNLRLLKAILDTMPWRRFIYNLTKQWLKASIVEDKHCSSSFKYLKDEQILAVTPYHVLEIINITITKSFYLLT